MQLKVRSLARAATMTILSFFVVGCSTAPCKPAGSTSRAPSSSENSWMEVSRFISVQATASESPKLQLQQTQEVTKENLLNCQFRLDISSANDTSEITDVLYATGTGTAGQIRFIGRFFRGPQYKLMPLPLAIEISNGSVSAFKAEDDPGNVSDSLALNRRVKILRMKCP